MKECRYLEEYWLCPNSQRRRFGTWQNSGHPCRFSVGSWIGEILCCFERYKSSKQKESESWSGTAQEGH